ncbi:glycosyltransferase family 4 protein [Peribacillus sp. NPDC056705]|uniref:glycosyltransferase family 4 protein n=1 Tax=Peribacillus sp. NPDC056705 TaxID=3345918 RepID=UPI003748E5C1
MNNNHNKRRIVFLIGSMRRGGAERVISLLANNYAERGWEVDILTLLDDNNEYELNRSINVKLIGKQGGSRIRKLPSWINSIRKHIIENKPDRIVSFIARINIITILSCIGLNQRIIVSERNDPKKDGRSALVRIATYILYPLADCVIFQTTWAKSCFPKRIQRKSMIISNPINITMEAANMKEKKIVAVGRLVEQKNHSLLISAFKKIYDEFPEYKLFIYGEGELREKLTNQIHELEIMDAVLLLGNVSNIHKKMEDAEIFVLSSNYEGLSNALLEAMLMGVPCVSTNCAGSNEVIKNNHNGLIIEIGNEEQLAMAIRELINNKEKAYNLGKNGKESVQGMKIENIISMWEEIIERNFVYHTINHK